MQRMHQECRQIAALLSCLQMEAVTSGVCCWLHNRRRCRLLLAVQLLKGIPELNDTCIDCRRLQHRVLVSSNFALFGFFFSHPLGEGLQLQKETGPHCHAAHSCFSRYGMNELMVNGTRQLMQNLAVLHLAVLDRIDDVQNCDI